MKKQAFNLDWTCNGQPVTLPHDAMIHGQRRSDAPFGSANPHTGERFDSDSYTTYYGRAMAVMRAGKAGKLVIHVRGGRDACAEVTIK